jgi:hypothetical protein
MLLFFLASQTGKWLDCFGWSWLLHGLPPGLMRPGKVSFSLSLNSVFFFYFMFVNLNSNSNFCLACWLPTI